MLLHILAEEGWIGESEFVADLFDAEVGMLQIVTNVFKHMLTNPFVSALPRFILTNR